MMKNRNSNIRKTFSTVFMYGERNGRKIILGILLCQCLFLVLAFISSDTLYRQDSMGYIVPARNFLSCGKMLDQNNEPILFRTPGYSLFLAVVYFCTGYSDTAVVFLQCLMVLGITGMVYYLTSAISGKKMAGCLAALLYACDLPVYENAVSVLTDTIFPFLLVLAFFWFYRYKNNHKAVYFVISVLTLNYAMLVRPQVMYYNMILAGLCIVLVFLRKVRWRECMIYVLAFLLVYAGWSYRNYCAYGEAMFTSVRAESYFKWYGPETYALQEGVTQEEAYAAFADMMAEAYPDYEKLSLIEQVYAEKEVGGMYLKQHIPSYLLLNLKGLVTEMVAPGMSQIRSWNFPSPVYWLFCCGFSGILLLSYLIYAVGFLGNIKKQGWTDWLILLTVMYLMASTAVLGYSRFRLAFYPLCLIGAFTCWRKRMPRDEV